MARQRRTPTLQDHIREFIATAKPWYSVEEVKAVLGGYDGSLEQEIEDFEKWADDPHGIRFRRRGCSVEVSHARAIYEVFEAHGAPAISDMIGPDRMREMFAPERQVETIALRLEHGFADQIRAVAKREGRTLDQWVARVLSDQTGGYDAPTLIGEATDEAVPQ